MVYDMLPYTLTALLVAAFLHYGLDVRRKHGARDLAGPAWQRVMRVCSFGLVAAFVWTAAAGGRLTTRDSLALALMTAGTAVVVAAKRALGRAHTFTGQVLEVPGLVTHGVYGATRNPLYLGVLLAEAGAVLFVLERAPRVWPHTHPYWLAVLGAALLYAIVFNWTMAVREARYLERHFGDDYRRYRARVPFVVPSPRACLASGGDTPAGAHPQRRPFRLDGETLRVAGAWYHGSPLTTQLLNAYTILVPAGERFVIRTCRGHLAGVTPGLRTDVEALFFQEGAHARAHQHVLDAMRVERLSLERFRRAVEWVSYEVLEPLTPPRLRLATAAAIEHHNATLARFFLSERLLSGVEAIELRRLFLWHFAEEIEHKETVFALLRTVSRSWALRALGIGVSLATFLAYLGAGTLLLGLRTRAVSLTDVRRLTRLSAALLAATVRYVHPGFHPGVEDTGALLAAALAELEMLDRRTPAAGEPPVSRPLPPAFHRKAARTLRRASALRATHPFFFGRIEGYDGTRLRSDGRRKLNFCTYSYLGLLHHPQVSLAARRAIERYGTGTHGVRVLGGNLDIHERLESSLAAFFRREAALTFSSGFMTNLAVVSALAGAGDYVLCDERDHASIVDGARLSRAEVVTFRHNDMGELADRLGRLPADARKLIVTDAVYSMDGDVAPLPALLALRDRHANTLLMVDEAHSLGVLGMRGRGIEEHFGCAGQIDVLMGTLSKTIPAQGGYVAGSHELVTFLRYNARGFVFSAALSPATTAAAHAALAVLDREGEPRRARLMANVRYFVGRLREEGFEVGPTESAIVPVMLRSDALAFDMARHCHDHGVSVMPVVFPAVARGAERLRMNVTCEHAREDLDEAIAVLCRDAGGRRVPAAAWAR